ncbi:MAG TPA: glycerol-3-phosphate acyltransferase, partial [Lysobacter sp.]|nr:glycerol-3-phosphate acyltransferase [Lysobacter sp.]
MLPVPAFSPLTLLLIAAGYLLGSLSGERVLARLRSPATGSAEGASGLQGRRFTAARLAFDIGKGALAAWLALRHAPVGDALSVTAHGYLAAFAAVLGHVWPIWHRFRGGAPTTALVGGLLVLWPVGLAAWLIAGLLVWLLSGYAGLAFVLGALCVLLLAWWGGSDPP